MSDDQADTTGEHIPIENCEKNEPDEDDSEIPPPRKHPRRAYMIGAIILVLLVVGGGLAALGTFGNPLAAAPSPTPTIVPGDNLFYFQEALPGTITVDGHPVAQILDYLMGPPLNPKLFTPFQLSRGVHHIVWQAAPFNPLSCTVFVPSLATTQLCPYQSSISLVSGINAWLITFIPTLSDLPAHQQTALKNSIQAILDLLKSSDTVQPGEQYLRANAIGYAAPVTAMQPLKATLSFHLDANPDSNQSCINGYGDICNENGQNCLQICMVSYEGGSWLAVALYYTTWTYSAESGQVIAQNQPDTNSQYVGTDHSILLQITWSSQGWSVRDISILSQAATVNTIYETSIPACASLTGLVNARTFYSSTSGDDFILIQWSYHIGSNPAAGCLGVVVPTDNLQAAPAYFLYRFGVLLAANHLAHKYFPSFPMADTYEQGIAQSIAAQIKS